jgi:hypothetical protein
MRTYTEHTVLNDTVLSFRHRGFNVAIYLKKKPNAKGYFDTSTHVQGIKGRMRMEMCISPELWEHRDFASLFMADLAIDKYFREDPPCHE